jgi:predicted DNA-binding protein
MNTGEPIPELTDRDKLFLLVLQDLPPYLVDRLINIQQHQGRPMAGFIAEALSEKLDDLSYEQAQQVIEHFRKQGIELENLEP